MKVNLCYQLADNKNNYKVINKLMTIKEAEIYYKNKLQSPEITRVWVRYFDGWRYRVKKILKE